MVKTLLAALLSAALIWAIPIQATPVNNSEIRIARITQQSEQARQLAAASEKVVKPVETPAPQESETQPEQATVVTPEPVVAETPQIVPQGCAAYVPLLQQYDWDSRVMAAVMQAESSCNPNAVSPPNWDGVRDYGIMQLHGQEIYDPATNIAHAYRLWTTQGYHAWSVYNSGAYTRFL